jgi:hypothetical protein
MAAIPDDWRLDAIDLRSIDENKLERDGIPVGEIPRVKILVKDCADATAIASWRHDTSHGGILSHSLRNCILEARRWGLFYLLVDVISIEQGNDKVIIHQVIEFSKLYSSLKSIIAYDIEVDIWRPWLRNEAFRIMNSPTSLRYALSKWELGIPLRPSLLIRQVCNRRLGMSNLNVNRLKLCDTYVGSHAIMSDLELTKNSDPNKPFGIINVNARRRQYASDILLIFEINRECVREALVKRLVSFKSNSVVVPALIRNLGLRRGPVSELQMERLG